jgi:hypothetical protein
MAEFDDVVSALINDPTPVEPEVEDEADVQDEPAAEVPEEAPEEQEETEEVEETEETDVNVDELEIDVQIDGETKSVKLKDLKAKYAGEGAIEKRLEETTKARQAMYVYTTELHKNLEAQAEKLRMLDEVIARTTQPDINWEELRAKDPGRYLLERDRFLENKERRTQLAQHQERIREEQARLNREALAEKAREESQILLNKLPALKKPETAKQILDDFVNIGQEYGFSQQEIDTVVDHRAMLVLHDAVQYRKLMAEKKTKESEIKPAQQQLKNLMRPTGKTANTSMDKNRRLHQVLVSKAKASGKPDDVAALLIVDRKKK